MTIITDQQDLNDLCAALARQPYIAVDTEFLRDKTYYPQLCLIQVAPPLEVEGGDPVAIDPLAGLDLAPFLEVMANPDVLKVFHAARQDLEIFYNLMGQVPQPLFDTQVAAMVCGHGDQAGYNTLVAEICRKRIDKGAQFTDWSRRPLSDKQVSYALDDVHYLRTIYIRLAAQLKETDREDWIADEMAVLSSPETYRSDPDQAWRRIKLKTDKPRVLNVLREVAAWREREAQSRNVPRNRILRDEMLADLAIHPPQTPDDLRQIRGVPEGWVKSRQGTAIIDAARAGLARPASDMPVERPRDRMPQDLLPVVEMLKMLLRIVASEAGVASRLIASGDDIEAWVNSQSDVDFLHGWRKNVFGNRAMEMRRGDLVLSLDNNSIVLKKI